MNKLLLITLIAALLTANLAACLSAKLTSKQLDQDQDPQDLLADDSKDDISKGVQDDAPKMEETSTSSDNTGPLDDQQQQVDQNDDQQQQADQQSQDQSSDAIADNQDPTNATDQSTNQNTNNVDKDDDVITDASHQDPDNQTLSDASSQDPDNQTLSDASSQDPDNQTIAQDNSIPEENKVEAVPVQEQQTQDDDFNKKQEQSQLTQDPTPTNNTISTVDDISQDKNFAQKVVGQQSKAADQSNFGPSDLKITPDMYGTNYDVAHEVSFLQIKSKTDLEPQDLQIEGHTGVDPQKPHYGNKDTLSSPPDEQIDDQQQQIDNNEQPQINLIQESMGSFIQNNANEIKKAVMTQENGFGPEDLHMDEKDEKNPNVYHEPAHIEEGVRSSPPGEPSHLSQIEIKTLLQQSSLLQEADVTFGPQDLKIEGHTGEIVKKDSQSYEREANDAVSSPPDKEEEETADQDQSKIPIAQADALTIDTNNQIQQSINIDSTTLEDKSSQLPKPVEPAPVVKPKEEAQSETPIADDVSAPKIQEEQSQVSAPIKEQEQMSELPKPVELPNKEESSQTEIPNLNNAPLVGSFTPKIEKEESANNKNFIVKVNHLNNNDNSNKFRPTNLIVNPLKTRLRRSNQNE